MIETRNLYSDIRDHYDELPFDYLDSRWERLFVTQSLFGELIQLVRRLPSEATLLDVGSGSGRLGEILRRHAGKIPISVDFSMASLRIACERVGGVCICALNENLPFSNRSFDAITSFGVIHHSPAPYRCLEECARVLRRGGLLYLSVYNQNHRYRLIYQRIVPLLRKLHSGKGFLRSLEPLMRLAAHIYHQIFFFRDLGIQGILSSQISRILYHDQFLIPYAVFFTSDTILDWGSSLGLHCLKHVVEDDRQMLSFIFRMNGHSKRSKFPQAP